MRALLFLVVAAGCGGPEAHRPLSSTPALDPSAEPDVVIVAPRTVGLALYPCTACHDGRALLEGDALHRIELRHMPGGDCTSCHDDTDFDQLHLITGEALSFDESGVLCAQCHFREGRDWDTGVHGKQIGKWQGEVRHRFACVSCHDAHAPGKFIFMRPLPPPARPRFGVVKGGH